MKVRRFVDNCLANIIGLFVSVNKSPVLVFGNAKSGTTIISYLLSQALQKSYTADIVRDIPDVSIPFQLEHKMLSIEDFVNKFKLEFSRGVIKEPALTNYASDFIRYLPDGKFVFIVRDPRDNIRSILNRLKIPGNLDNANLDDWPELAKTRAWRLSLDDVWKRNRCGGNYIEVMAKNWMSSYEQYKINSGKASLMKYEAFYKDKSYEIHHLCQSIGLEVKKDISSIVDLQMQTKGNAGCDLIEFFGERNLLRIEKICKEGILNLGYAKTIIPQNSSMHSHGS